MLLAAGLGTRMRPLTAAIPKPTLPALDRPMIRRLIDQLADHGIESAVVNSHAHPELLAEALRGAAIPVEHVFEAELRGSGGGIAGARALLEDATFLVLNADMVLDLRLPELISRHREIGGLATLALRDDPRKSDFGTIGFGTAGQVTRITSMIDLGAEAGSGLFTGVQVMEPEIFDAMPSHSCFEILPHTYLPLLSDGARVGTWLQPTSDAWHPIGTPRELLDANLALLAESGASRWVGAGAVIPASASLGPGAIIGAGAELSADTSIRNSVVLPNARPPAGSALERAIAFEREVWRDD